MKRFVFLTLICVCFSGTARAYNRIQTEQKTINPTPSITGVNSGRLCLTVKNRGDSGTASVFCGPCVEPFTEYWELTPGEQYTWGSNHKEAFSAQEQMCCYSETGNQDINLSEEGDMPPWTPTPTNTPTATPTP